MRPNPQFPVDLVTFTEAMLNGKLYFHAVTGVAVCQMDIQMNIYKYWQMQSRKNIY